MPLASSPSNDRADDQLLLLDQRLNRVSDRISLGRSARSSCSAEELQDFRGVVMDVLKRCGELLTVHVSSVGGPPADALARLQSLEQRALEALARIDRKLQEA